MAFNSIVGNFNQQYIRKQISDTGVYDEAFGTFTFNVMGPDGDPNGYSIVYAMRSGLINRTDKNGISVCRGLASDSNHADGRITVEICTPYNEEVHCDTSCDKLNIKNHKVVSVKWTCYIHVIAGAILGHLSGAPVNDSFVVNHIDGCPLHNWASNLERVSRKDNSIHGVVIQSIFHAHVCDVKYTSNNVAYFPFVYNRYIPAQAVVEYMQVDDDFRESVNLLYKQIRDKKCESRDWLTDHQLINFLAWGMQVGLIK